MSTLLNTYGRCSRNGLYNRQPHHPKNAEELKAALLEKWEKIEIELINHLIESMEDHVQTLLKAKGGSTCY